MAELATVIALEVLALTSIALIPASAILQLVIWMFVDLSMANVFAFDPTKESLSKRMSLREESTTSESKTAALTACAAGLAAPKYIESWWVLVS
jgi:hypothetical protein